MKKAIWLFVLALSLAAPAIHPQQQWSMAYWTPWDNLRPDGTLDLSSQRISSDGPVLITTTVHTRGVKVSLGVMPAYWLGQTANLLNTINLNRSLLVDRIMSFVDDFRLALLVVSFPYKLLSFETPRCKECVSYSPWNQ